VGTNAWIPDEAEIPVKKSLGNCPTSNNTRKGEEPMSRRRQRRPKESQAIALALEFPDLTDCQIATMVPCSRSSLYRMRLFVGIRRKLKESAERDFDPPRGSKFREYENPDQPSMLEAWDEKSEED
jgi:hypothetical protein